MTTMREFYEEEGHEPEDLVHPRDVEAEDISDDSVVIAYGYFDDPTAEHGHGSYQLQEFEIDDVVPADEVEEYTDGMVSYPDETPVTHGVVWSYKSGTDVPNFASIGYGEEMYGEDSDFTDPNRWDRSPENVRGLGENFVRFKL